MKVFKKILKITGITLLSLIVLAFLIPIVFKKQITRLVKKEINKSINAKVDFSDVRLNLLRHFPRVTIIVKDLSIVGSAGFEGDTLLYAKKTEASANLFSVIKGKNINVYGAYLRSPRIHAWVNKNGKANWDIAKPSSSTSTDTSASAFKMSLKNYAITDGYIVFEDESAGTYTAWKNVDHRGSGDITADEFTLKTVTHASEATFIQDAIPYLSDTKADIITDIKVNTKTQTYTFKTDEIVLNNLKLSAEGFFRMINASTFDIDVKFKSPSNDFKDILSMIPAVYKQDFDKIKTSGSATFNGFVKGTFAPGRFPAYDVNVEVKNGSFQYPDLPKPVKNINLDLNASNIDGSPDNAVIDISNGHMEMDNEPFDFRFIYKNPVTVQYIDAAAKGKVDLAQLSQFIKLANGTKLSGLVWADAYAKGNMSKLEKFQPFAAGGFFDVKNLFYSAKDFPQPIRNGNMSIRLDNTGGIADNTKINISSGHIEVGNDPLDFTLQLSNPVTTMNFNGSAKGRFNLGNVKQFTSFPTGTSLNGMLNADMSFTGNKEIINKGQYDKMKLDGTASISNMRYVTPDYPSGIAISTATANFNPANAGLSNFSGNYLGSNFSGNGTLNNLVSFIAKNEPLTGTINASVDKMNLNDWTGTSDNTATATTNTTSSSTSSSSPFLVPANMNVTLNAKAGQVVYDKVNYNNINGTVLLNNETVKFQSIRANALDGTILLNGSYSTKNNKVKPDISMSYDIDNMDVQKAFNAFNPIQFIMPIGKFLSGKLNSELTMTGNLTGNMIPDLQSLTGKGNLLLVEGVLKKFAPLEKIAALLQIDRLKSISVKDIKNYIEFSHGKVLVKPFDLKIEDIMMTIGGTHGFDQSLEYIIGMKVPRKYLGNAGNNLVNDLVSKATSKGIPIKSGETISLNIKVTGTLSNPSIGINLEQVVGDVMEDLKDQAKDYAQEKIDSLKAKAKDTIASKVDKVKDSLKQKLKDQLFGKDTAQQNNNPADTSKKSSGGIIKDKIKDIFNRNKKPKDTIQNR
ncbi:MAG: hypothetical protein HOP10_08255 [Chitinophagaceae bacterium]|nr:hypothetical protein [Chitinophagaceae bacterium]